MAWSAQKVWLGSLCSDHEHFFARETKVVMRFVSRELCELVTEGLVDF